MEMVKENDFVTPSAHVSFLAKKLFEDCGEIMNGSIAYLQPVGTNMVRILLRIRGCYNRWWKLSL